MNNRLKRKLIQMYDIIESPYPYRTKTVAFIIYKNKIISYGVNSSKTDVFQHYCRRNANLENDADFIYDTLHAEVDAIKKVRTFHYLNRCEIVVISKKKDKTFRLAKPCPICSNTIKTYGIKKVYYSTDDNKIIGGKIC